MKKQDFKDRMHEHKAMSHEHHMKHHGHKEAHSIYKNEVEKPSIPPIHANEPMEPVADYKGMSMDTAYGQAGKHGLASDEKKIHAQFKSYGWDANTGY